MRRRRREGRDEDSISNSVASRTASPSRTTTKAMSSNQHLQLALVSSALITLAASSPAEALIPEFLSYKTCMEAPPDFSGCMTNVTADIGERVVLNCQVRMNIKKFWNFMPSREVVRDLRMENRSSLDSSRLDSLSFFLVGGFLFFLLLLLTRKYFPCRDIANSFHA